MPETKKVIFYIANYYVFRSATLGYLHEIAGTYPVIFLSEKLDSESEELLKNKKFFPRLEKIIPVRQYDGRKINLFAKNRYLYKTAKYAVYEVGPDIVVSGSDTHSLFELYLMRMAKRKNLLKITVQNANMEESSSLAKRVDLINAYLRFPPFLPFFLRIFLVKFRKYLGHFLYYWVLPLSVGEKPFFGKASHILRKGNSGMRDSNYQTAFSERDYEIFLKDGVPAEKLYILSHPLISNRDFFEEAFFEKNRKGNKDKKIVSVMLPDRRVIGLRKNDFSLISMADREKEWVEIVKLISRILPRWQIYIKPHPDNHKDIEKIRKNFGSISQNIKVTDPKEPADKYIEMGDIIIGLPFSASTVIFTASLQCPEKPILSLDFYPEVGGDYYKDFNDIEYIDSREDLVKMLELIRDNKYRKKPKEDKKEEMTEKKFSNIVEMIEYFLKKKENNLL